MNEKGNERGNGKPPMPLSRLGTVKRAPLDEPLRYMFYGSEGIGKSTLAAYAPSPIWLDCEGGTGRLSVARYPFRDGPGGHAPQSYQEVLDAVADLTASDHAYRTLVLDTIDRLQGLIWARCLERDGGRVSALNKAGKKLESIESYGYGKGYIVAFEEWKLFAARLEALRTRRQMSVVLLGHAQIRTFKNPSGEDYDRYSPRVHDQAAGFLKEWCDVVGFCCFDEGGAKLDPDDRRAKGYSTGRRLVRFERTAAYDAKSRIPLPAELELATGDPWAPIARAVEDARTMPAPKIMELIRAECIRIADAELTAKVVGACKGIEDTATLARYLYELRRRNVTQPKEEALS